MLFRIDFEIGIYPDRIQVSDRKTGRFADFAAEIPFSKPNMLIADAVYFENALAKAMRKAMSGGFILYHAQACVLAGDRLGAEGRQTVRRALRDIGFKTVRFENADDEEPLPPLPASLAVLF